MMSNALKRCRDETAYVRRKRRRSLLTVLGILAATLALSLTPARAAEARLALVIGNSAYQHVPRLANPGSDARLIAKALEAAGFDLVGGGPQLDLDKAGIEGAIREFGRRLGENTVGLFYYAGHGIQVNGTNYLVPVTANASDIADVKYELVDAGLVLDEMTQRGNSLNIVLLDACRNNPFADRRLRTLGRGLAQLTAPPGTVIGYSTQPGSVADDGGSRNGPYAEALARVIVQPGLSVFEAFNSVGLDVETATRGRQQPWLATSPIKGQFRFIDKSEPQVVTASPETPAKEPTTSARPAQAAIEQIANARPASIAKPAAAESAPGTVEQAATTETVTVPTKPPATDPVSPPPAGAAKQQAVASATAATPMRHPQRAKPVAAPSPAATALTTPRADIQGRWQGRYRCQNDEVGVTLEIEPPQEGHISAVFESFPLPGALSFPASRFRMTGDYDRAGGVVRLRASEWIQRPMGMQSHDFEGRLSAPGNTIAGRVLTTGCAEFVVERK
jgi:hypothetical protein